MEGSLPEDVTACLMSQGNAEAVRGSWEPPQVSPPVFPHWGLHVGGKLCQTHQVWLVTLSQTCLKLDSPVDSAKSG